MTVKVTAHFEAIRKRADRAVIREEWIERAIRQPIREYVQPTVASDAGHK